MSAAPRPGEVYIQLGVRMVVLYVGGGMITYVCRSGNTTGITINTPLALFEGMLDRGLIARAED